MSARRERPGLTFFVDISLGHVEVPSILRDCLRETNDQLVLHRDHFSQDADDVDWISAVARHGWIVLSKDQFLESPLEREGLRAGKLAAFFLSKGEWPAEINGRALCLALPKIRQAVLDHEKPLLAVVYRTGRIRIIEKGARKRRGS